MSFTDGKQREATEEEIRAPWCGKRDGYCFRCRLCGWRFRVGDVWRWVFANFKDSPSNNGNFLVCLSCDGADVLDRAAKQEQEAKDRFWWLRQE